MREYILYPGCSAEGSAREYKAATLELLSALGAQVRELPDWTCCGASVAPVVSERAAVALPARNLALAEREGPGAQLIAICSACYTNLRRVAERAHADRAFRAFAGELLAREGLALQGTVEVRHILDVLWNDFGPQAIRERLRRPLQGLLVAPYYGCQTVRPFGYGDDPQRPQSMAQLLEAAGANIHHYGREASCCGTSLLMTKMEVGLAMVQRILEGCRGADCIATVCPMCQLNLEAYQKEASRLAKVDLAIPVVYLPQLLGLALGLEPAKLQFGRNLTPAEGVLAKV